MQLMDDVYWLSRFRVGRREINAKIECTGMSTLCEFIQSIQEMTPAYSKDGKAGDRES